MKKIICLVFIFCSFSVQAYTNFIGHSYTSCLNCHFNPFGGGPLNDYGRVVSATLISSRQFYDKKTTDEKLAYTSGFMFDKPKQNWFRSQINYRGFRLVNNPGSSKEEARFINMQADARAILKFGENDRFVMVGNYGYAPVPKGGDESQSSFRSREHYMGYRFTPKIGVYAGLMDKAFGLRVIEHIAYSRTSPQVTMNDQTHGVLAHILDEKWELGVHGFMGNMQQDETLRMRGFSSTFEHTIYDIHRVGGSMQRSYNSFLEMTALSAHTRLNLKEGSAVLAELGQTIKTAKLSGTDVTDRYALIQTYLRPQRGLYFLTNIEYYNRDIKQDDFTVRWGPGVQYFPMQRVEARLDMYNTRSFAKESSSRDSWMYLLQLHLWL